ncbi:hypothetical protein H4Q26_014327 [Puccinia striiformis f. sp. tritici PST-130]|nr:hypothetical protein H4Q26_014327 [Puccinia striiformis f. sp. tritici PST-130]
MGLRPPNGVAKEIQATMHSNKKAMSSNAPWIATGANGEPQGKDLHSRASKITSPEIHLTSCISQRHDELLAPIRLRRMSSCS